MITITKVSPISGKSNTMALDITEEQMKRWAEGELIQKVMSHLTADEREFLITGITSKEWEDNINVEEK